MAVCLRGLFGVRLHLAGTVVTTGQPKMHHNRWFMSTSRRDLEVTELATLGKSVLKTELEKRGETVEYSEKKVRLIERLTKILHETDHCPSPSPTTGALSWTKLPSLPSARHDHGCVVDDNGDVWVFGGMPGLEDTSEPNFDTLRQPDPCRCRHHH